MKQLSFYEYLQLPQREADPTPGWYRDEAKPDKVYLFADDAWQTYTWSPHPSTKARGVDTPDAPRKRKSQALPASVGKIDLFARMKEYLGKQGLKPRSLRHARQLLKAK